MYQCTRINQRKTPYSVCRVTPCSLLQASDHLLSRWECEDAELRQELHGLQGFMAPMKDGNRHGKKWGVMDQAPEDEGYEGWRFGSQFPFILFFFTNVKGCIPYLYIYIFTYTHIYIYIFTHLNIHFELNLYTSPKKKMHFLSPSILQCFLPGSMASAAAELRSGLWRLKSDCQGTGMTTLSGALATALPQLAQRLGCRYKPVMNFFGWGKEIRCARFFRFTFDETNVATSYVLWHCWLLSHFFHGTTCSSWIGGLLADGNGQRSWNP